MPHVVILNWTRDPRICGNVGLELQKAREVLETSPLQGGKSGSQSILVKGEKCMRELDVRPVIRAGDEPIGHIMDFVANLAPAEEFRLRTTVKPGPICGVLRIKGYAGSAKEVSPGNWVISFTPMREQNDGVAF
jgi:hypothetical protein